MKIYKSSIGESWWNDIEIEIDLGSPYIPNLPMFDLRLGDLK